MTVRSAQTLPGSSRPVDHLVFTDGVAFVSVFVEHPEVSRAPGSAGQPVSAPDTAPEAATVGSSSAFSTVVDGHRVTAVGEVPPATVQFIAVAWAGYASGMALIIALAVAIAAIYGQTTVGDIVISRYVADAWRGRVYAVRYFLSFISSGIAVQLIAQLYSRGGFDLVLGAIALAAFLMLMGVYVMAAAVNGAETAQRAVQPQPAE